MAIIMNAAEAVSKINDHDRILFGGFLAVGTPDELIDEILKQGKKDLTGVCNDGGYPDRGVGKLIHADRFKKFICSWLGYTPYLAEQSNLGNVDLELCPQGSLVERIRAGGFGLGGILTQTGLNTMVEEKYGQRVTLNGRDWLYQAPIRGNVAIVEAYRADEAGNLIFRRAQRNFAPVMSYAADLVIAAVVNPIEPKGSIDPDEVMVPGVAVDILVPLKGGANP